MTDPDPSQRDEAPNEPETEEALLGALTPEQLHALSDVRDLRRASDSRATAALLAMDARMKTAFTTQSEQRHRYMVLAGGALALSVPLLGRSDLDLWTWMFVRGSLLLGLHIAVGVAIDASQEARWAETVAAAHEDVVTEEALRMAEDVRMGMALRGDFNPHWAANERDARHTRVAAAHALAVAGRRRQRRTNGLVGLFYATFLLGVGLMLASVLPAAPSAPRGPQTPAARPPVIAPADRNPPDASPLQPRRPPTEQGTGRPG